MTVREVGRYWDKNPSWPGSFDRPKKEREKETCTRLARGSRGDLVWVAQKAFCNFYSTD
jgi:hypothetical protein